MILDHSVLGPLKFCVIDIETTGSNPKSDRIIDIGMVYVDGLKVQGSKGIVINPQKKIPPFIQKLTGLGDEDIKDAPTIEEVIDDIIAFIGDRIIVAHNIAFDLPFLNDTIKKLKRTPLNNRTLCTQIMSKYLIPNMMNSNLTYLCDLFHIQHERAHQALSDAKATAELLVHYLHFFKNRGIEKVNQLYYPKHHFEFDRLHLSSAQLDGNSAWSAKYLAPIKGPFSFSGKGEAGQLLYINAFTHGQHFLQSVPAESLPPLKQVSLKIFGTLLEAFNHVREGYLKAAKPQRAAMMKMIEEVHQLATSSKDLKISPEFKQKKEVAEWMEQLKKDHLLILCKHLVPDQINIFTAPFFHHREMFTFKVSTQRKKLIQFLEQTQKRHVQSSAKKIDTGTIDLRLASLFRQLLELELHKNCYLSLSSLEIQGPLKDVEEKINSFNHVKIKLHDYPAKPL